MNENLIHRSSCGRHSLSRKTGTQHEAPVALQPREPVWYKSRKNLLFCCYGVSGTFSRLAGQVSWVPILEVSGKSQICVNWQFF